MYKMNLIFLGSFPYPHGMAGTKRIQHAIDGLKRFEDVNIRVIVLRHSSVENPPAGVYQGIPYETVMPDLMRMKLALLAPLFFSRAKSAIRRAFDSESKNILFVYGPPTFDNIPVLRFARKLGFKIVFDIVEDGNLDREVTKNPWLQIKSLYIHHATNRITSLADGIIVISSHLEKKFCELTSGTVPLHYQSISVDMDRYPEGAQRFGDPVTIFYGGGFSPKDGVDNLIRAFDILTSKGLSLRLVITGPDNQKELPRLLSLCRSEATVNKIEYLGYLNDDEYYRVLCQADIPCVPRTDIGYAHAGFPFKLGEYLATGKPVVVSSVSDVCRFVENRHNAVIVKPGSVESLVDGITYLILHPSEAFQIGTNGRLTAREVFDYRSQASPLYSFIAEL